MCSAFSQLQTLNFPKMNKADIERMINYGRKHLEFAIELYKIQIKNQLYFLHEHPWRARSWKEEEMRQLLAIPGVVKVRGDMCQFDMIQEDGQGIGRIRKSTGFATNSPQIAAQLSRVCQGGHRHIQLISGRAKAA